MGVYDTIEIGDREGQVKLWGNTLLTRTIGDVVPRVQGSDTYNIAMREGGFVWVEEGFITGWHSEPFGMTIPIFDKYGEEYNEETRGELDEVMNDPYLFR